MKAGPKKSSSSNRTTTKPPAQKKTKPKPKPQNSSKPSRPATQVDKTVKPGTAGDQVKNDAKKPERKLPPLDWLKPEPEGQLQKASGDIWSQDIPQMPHRQYGQSDADLEAKQSAWKEKYGDLANQRAQIEAQAAASGDPKPVAPMTAPHGSGYHDRLAQYNKDLAAWKSRHSGAAAATPQSTPAAPVPGPAPVPIPGPAPVPIPGPGSTQNAAPADRPPRPVAPQYDFHDKPGSERAQRAYRARLRAWEAQYGKAS